MTRKFKIIVYGGSGLAAKYVIKRLLQSKIPFAVAGRSIKKIEENLKDIKIKSNFELFEKDLSNLNELSAQSEILINCAGPFVYSGESVVKTCIQTKTHYIDITGETFFIENCIKKYNEAAKTSKIYVINCAGFDSIPADIGTQYFKECILRKKDYIPSEIVIESILNFKDAYINYTTYQSAILGFAKKNETRAMRKSNNAPKSGQKSTKIKKLFYSKDVNAYCGVFPGTDASVVKRSQEYLHKKSSQAVKCKYLAYIKLGGLFKTTMIAILGGIFTVFAKSGLGRSLLLKFPQFFTLNLIKKQRPSEKEIEMGKFELKMTANIYKDGKEHEKQKMIIKGPDPGYNATAICVTESAKCLLDMIENQNIDFEGGVVTPASVFPSIELVKMLDNAGIHFKILE